MPHIGEYFESVDSVKMVLLLEQRAKSVYGEPLKAVAETDAMGAERGLKRYTRNLVRSTANVIRLQCGGATCVSMAD